MFAAPPRPGLGKLEEGKRPSVQWLEWQRVRQSKRATAPREHQFWALPLEPLGAPPAQSSSTRLSVLPARTGNRRIRRQQRARRASPVQRNSPDPLLRVRLPGLRAPQVVDEGGSESVNTEVHRPLSTAEDRGRPVFGLSPWFPHEQCAQDASTHAETLDVEKLRKIGNETARSPGGGPGTESEAAGGGDGLVVPEDDDDFVDVDEAEMTETAAATGAPWVWGGSRPPRALPADEFRDATYRRAEPSEPRPWVSSARPGETAPTPARDDLLELEELEDAAATAPTSALAPLAPPSKFVTGTSCLPRVATLHSRGVSLRDRGPGFAGKSDLEFLRASRASSAALAATFSPPARGEGQSSPGDRSPAAGGRERRERTATARRPTEPVPWTMDRLDRRLRELEWFKYLGPEHGVGPSAGKAGGGHRGGESRSTPRPRSSIRGGAAPPPGDGTDNEVGERVAAPSVDEVEGASRRCGRSCDCTPHCRLRGPSFAGQGQRAGRGAQDAALAVRQEARLRRARATADRARATASVPVQAVQPRPHRSPERGEQGAGAALPGARGRRSSRTGPAPLTRASRFPRPTARPEVRRDQRVWAPGPPRAAAAAAGRDSAPGRGPWRVGAKTRAAGEAGPRRCCRGAARDQGLDCPPLRRLALSAA